MPNLSQFESKEEYNQYMRDYRKKNLEKIREYKRVWSKNYRKKNNYKYENAYKKRYPEKIKATQKLNREVYSGNIKREPCIICGNERSQGHHEDYSKPLDVIWLCSIHHKEVHMSTLKKVLKNNGISTNKKLSPHKSKNE